MVSSIFSFIAAFLGYWVAHYFACQRQRKEQKINFIFRELSDFVTIVDDAIEELIQLSESEDFRQILLLRQRHINRKSEFVYKILQTAKIEDDNLKKYVEELKEHLSGEESSCIVSNKVQETHLQKIRSLILSSVDDIKLKLIEQF